MLWILIADISDGRRIALRVRVLSLQPGVLSPTITNTVSTLIISSDFS